MNKFIVFLVLALVSTSVFLYVRPVFAASIFSDGFESGDFSAWTTTGGSPIVQDTTVHHGTYAASGTAGNYAYKDFAAQTTTYARCYFLYTGTFSSGYVADLLWLRDTTGNNLFLVYISNQGGTYKWGLRNFVTGGGHTWSSEQFPSPGTWYCVELMAGTTATGAAKVYVDGNELTDISWSGDASSSPGANRVYVLQSNGEAGLTMYVDCVVVDSSYIGPESYTLAASVVGQGSVSKSPDQATYDWGTNVELTAHANLGWTFASWSGGASGTSNPVTVTITDNTAVTATFTQNPAPPVGGEWVPIDKLQLSTPLISLISLMTMLTTSFVYVRRKRQQN